MNYLVALLLGVVGTLGIQNVPLAKQPTDYSDTSSLPYHQENKCKSTGNFFEIVVEVVYPSDMKGSMGRWKSLSDTIELSLGMGTDIDTIAHEVHHMVDTMMRRYSVEDEHYAAWLQGSFTNCIYQIVEEDLKNFQ